MIRLDRSSGTIVRDDAILTADDLAPTLGASTYREWMHIVREKSKLARLIMKGRRIGEKVQGTRLDAQVENGRWIVRCECGGVENVTPNDPVVFCFSCLNTDNGFNLRPVRFPKKLDRDAAEILLMKRSNHRDMNWLPEKSVIHLEKENKKLKKEGKAR